MLTQTMTVVPTTETLNPKPVLSAMSRRGLGLVLETLNPKPILSAMSGRSLGLV